MITTTHRVTQPVSPATQRPRDAAPSGTTSSASASVGTQIAVRVLRLCNSRMAHVALEPMPWRRK